ncbi:hypothetical protein CALCODRAFT_431126, partial [Calocera cornea HHB12733]
VPLILAWALTVHKAQGQSLFRVRIDVSRSFDNGHLYVAISRAVCAEGLELIGYNPNMVRIDVSLLNTAHRNM